MSEKTVSEAGPPRMLHGWTPINANLQGPDPSAESQEQSEDSKPASASRGPAHIYEQQKLSRKRSIHQSNTQKGINRSLKSARKAVRVRKELPCAKVSERPVPTESRPSVLSVTSAESTPSTAAQDRLGCVGSLVWRDEMQSSWQSTIVTPEVGKAQSLALQHAATRGAVNSGNADTVANTDQARHEESEGYLPLNQADRKAQSSATLRWPSSSAVTQHHEKVEPLSNQDQWLEKPKLISLNSPYRSPEAQGRKHSQSSLAPQRQSPSRARRSCDVLGEVSGNSSRSTPDRSATLSAMEMEFEDADLDDALMALISPHSAENIAPEASSKGKRLFGSAAAPTAEDRSMKATRAPDAVRSLPSTGTHVMESDVNGQPLPFARPPFPNLALDRSPVHGLSNQTALRCCFRMGEALNAATSAARQNIDAVIELYARVIASRRVGLKQHFQFADVFTDNPPHLKGTFSLWRGVELWDEDSKVFLGATGQGKLSRVLGRVRKSGAGEVEMDILSIWHCSWLDLEIAKAIVIPPPA